MSTDIHFEDKIMKFKSRILRGASALLFCLAMCAQAAAQVYTYDDIGRLRNVAYPSGANIAYTYDLNSNIKSITHTGIAAPLAPDGMIDTPADDVTIEVGQNVDFSGTGADPDGAVPLAFRWDFDGAAPDSNEEDPGQVTFANEGVYTVEFFVTDATGITDPTPASVTVTVQAASAQPPPPPANPPAQQVQQKSGGGSAVWLPLLLLLIRLRRFAARALVPVVLACNAQAADWAPMNSPTNEHLYDVWGASADAVYAVGANGTVLFFDGEEWSTLDPGVSTTLRAVWGRSANDVYVVGDATTFLHFDGQNWSSIDIGDTGFNFVDVWSPGPNERLWLVATTGAWYNDGSGWTRQGFTDFLTVSFTPQARLTGIGGTRDYIVVTSVPNGSTFNGLYVNFKDKAPVRANSIFAFSDTEMYVVGESARRLNGGNAANGGSWAPINVSSGSEAVWGSSPGDMFAVGALSRNRSDGSINHYDGNAENTWVRMLYDQNTVFKGVWGFGPTNVIAVGTNGTIMRYFEPPPPATAANFPFSAMATDHINAHTGELVHIETDFSLGHVMPFTFERYYASGLLNDTRIGGLLGRNWTHNYEWRLIQRDSNGVPEVEIITPRGRNIVFQKPAGEWELTRPLATPFLLVESDAEFHFADPVSERIYRFDKPFHKLVSIEDRNGNRLWLNYYQTILVSVEDRKGNEIVLDYLDGDTLGGVHTLGTSTTASPKLNVVFEYTNGNLSSVTDPEGRVTSYEYEPARENQALLQAVHLPLTTDRRWLYNDKRQVVTEQIIEGGEISVEYGELSTVLKNPDTTQRSYSHNDDGALTRSEDELGNVRTFEYNPDGRRTKLVDRIGREFGWTYAGGSFKVETATRPDQRGYTMTYEQNGSKAGLPFYDVVRVDFPDGSFVTMDYDGFGNPTMYTDQESKTWTFTNTPAGQVETVTNPLFGVTTYEYWSHGGLQDIVDHDQNRTRFRYDGYQRLTGIEFPGVGSRSYTWNDRNDIVTTTTELGETWEYSYDADGNVEQVASSSGDIVRYRYTGRGVVDMMLKPGLDGIDDVTSFSYDDFGRLAGISRPDLTAYEFGYSEIGQFDTVLETGGKSWEYKRDAEGTPEAISMPGGDAITMDNSDNALRRNTIVKVGNEKTSVVLDEMGRTRSIIDGLENTTNIELDRRGLVTKVTQPEPGVVTTIERNDLGQASKVTEPEGGEWKNVHDETGRIITATDPLNRATTIRHDERSRPESVTFPNNAGDVTIAYNASNQVTSQQYSDGTVIELDYDTQGRPRSGDGIALDFNPRGNMNDSNSIVINYDDNDRIERITMTPGRFIEYRYDDRGNLEAVSDWLGGQTTIDPTERGQVESVNLPNGVSNVYAYDRAGRISDIAFGAIGSISLTRDWRGQVTQATRQLPGPRDIETEQRLYDFNPANEVTRFSYDVLGNLRQNDSKTYEFDLASRMTSYDGENGRVAVTYDALGNRISSVSTTKNRTYVWNYAFSKERVAVEQEAGQDLWYYVYTTSGRLLYRINGDGIRHFYHFDENGNTVFLTDNAGNVIQTYFYSPLGEVLDEFGNVDNDRKFAAEDGAMQMDESLMLLLENKLLDLRDGILMTTPKPAEFQIFDYRQISATAKPALSNSAPDRGTEMLQDTLVNLAGLTMSGGEKILKMQPLTGSLFDIPLNSIGKTTFRLGGGFMAGFGGGMAGGREFTRGEFKSDAARNVSSVGVTITNTAASACPQTAIGMIVVTGIDALCLRFTGRKTGIPDVMLNNVPRLLGATVDATYGGQGWEAARRRTENSREKEGWAGWAITGLSDYVYGPVAGELWNIYSGENARKGLLEAKIAWANFWIDREE